MSLFGDKLRSIFDSLNEKHFINDDVLDNTAKEIQKALILADVEISLVFEISKKIKELKGIEIPNNLNPKEFLIKKYMIFYLIFLENLQILIKPIEEFYY